MRVYSVEGQGQAATSGAGDGGSARVVAGVVASVLVLVCSLV